MSATSRLFGASEGKILTVKLGEQTYGIPILEAREVVRMMKVQEIPQTPHFMRGVINLRGKIHPVIDLRIKFGISNPQDTSETCILMVDLAGNTTGMIVDMLIGVATLEESEFEEHPDLGQNIKANFVLGVAKMEEQVILVLDLNQVLSNEELAHVLQTTP